MPELPEVETVRRGLNSLIVGKKIISAKSDNPKSFPNNQNDVDTFLMGFIVTGVRRRAKVLLIDLSSKHTLVIHLKMTGQLVFVDKISRFGAGHPSDSLVGGLPDKSTRVTFDFSDGSKLFFNDQRKFGWVRLVPTLEVPNIDFMKRVGPEPLESTFTPADFIARFKTRPRTNIKAALLDQKVIAGVGNIYADESLWGAKIHPSRLVCDISDKELKKLYEEVRFVMNLSIEKGGSTNRNYVNAEGKKGSYMDLARVFRREGLDCSVCGSQIVKLRVAGRGTHICPVCQKI
ncbi:MAG: bifunctional DNA-formamidopyrimidine glycosylase/DNA-(apurinic or apyrimidinic site) lyase [Candidatus Saccharibacteria bacterium]